ncbi:hypothetical protein [Marinitoga sp. 1138]|uniref:hypothetical protein n=1 Tax=Marinitoga sp. 1138 TaxID=1643334 RepID=UPI001585EC0C|nr:hypothetical protein [Marinitoga sp. 1138]NUU97736.1 hypothetical protein [Marinitoga sp. 1138]
MKQKIFYCMLFFFPVTSVVLTNKIKGITPSFFFFMVYILYSFFNLKKEKSFSFKFIVIILSLLVYISFQRILNIVYDTELSNDLILVSKEVISNNILRRSQITQLIYLLFGVFYFIIIYKNINKNNFLKIKNTIKLSLTVFMIYGYYELIGYFIFNHSNVDFLSNRIFGENYSANVFQTFMGIRRMDSFAGEPSMYAFTLLPFLGFYLFEKNYKMSFFIILSLILSTSGTALVGMLIFFISVFILKPKKYNFRKKKLLLYIIWILLLIYPFYLIYPFIEEIILFNISKFKLQHVSGISRYNNFKISMEYFKDQKLVIQFFGVGFGTIRDTNMFSTLLINVGIVGSIIYSAIFLIPIFYLYKKKHGYYLISSLLSLYIVHMLSVPEFSYLSIWTFLALVYYIACSENHRI